MPEMTWETKTWSQMSADDVFAVMKLRTDVFFLEQRITEEELDDDDKNPHTIHIWAETRPGVAVAYVRVVRKDPAPTRRPAGIGLSIGRLVVDSRCSRGRPRPRADAPSSCFCAEEPVVFTPRRGWRGFMLNTVL
jgi:predicted GNAT family N-acyltransferase